MRRKLQKSLLFCLVITALTSFGGCFLVKKSVSGRQEMSNDENVVRKVTSTQPDWKYLEIRMTGRADESGNKTGFMGTIRMEKGKQISIVLRSTIGIELAKVYANRDSVWLVSRMLNIKEKGDWKLMVAKIGYPVDFYAVQGIFTQTLFTSAGDNISDLIENLIVKNDKEDVRLVSNSNFEQADKGIKYLNEFILNKENYIIEGAKIRDIKGQWIADVKYLYNKDNVVKKIELKGIDSERDFAVEINVIKKEIKDNLEINFEKF
jgi:hypothetical protein